MFTSMFFSIVVHNHIEKNMVTGRKQTTYVHKATPKIMKELQYETNVD